MTALCLVVGMRAADSCVSTFAFQRAFGWPGWLRGFPSFPTILRGTHRREEDKASIKIIWCNSSQACYTDVKGQIPKSFISCLALCEHRADCYSRSKMWGGGLNCGFGFSHTILFSFRHELAHSRCSVKVRRQALIAFEWLSTPRQGMTQGKHFFVNLHKHQRIFIIDWVLDELPPWSTFTFL